MREWEVGYRDREREKSVCVCGVCVEGVYVDAPVLVTWKERKVSV